jgi:hypothetical protein
MKRTSRTLEEFLETAMEEIAPTEEIAWDFTMLPPTEQFQNAYLVSLTAPSTLLGQLICISFVMQAGYPLDFDGVKEALRQGIEQVRQQRSAAIQMPQSNGKGSGLIL